MNKPALPAFRPSAQAGFTLIELIVVIVILGILAATALPKFSSLSGDARLASLGAARGALASVSAMTHGQFMINTTGPYNFEGTSVTVVNGYPSATTNTAAAAGLTADYTVIGGAGTAVDATANAPAAPVGTIIIQPKSIASLPAGLNCYVSYTEAAAGGQPAITTVGTANACNN